MKKTISAIVLALVLFALAVTPVLAVNTGIEYGTYTGLGTKDIREGVMNVINTLLGFLGIIAIVIIMWGGFRWMTSGGSEEKTAEAKKIITAGLIGLVIIFISFALASFVITQLISATGAS